MELFIPIINNIQTAFKADENAIPVYFYLQNDLAEGMGIVAKMTIPSLGFETEIEYTQEQIHTVPPQTEIISLRNKTVYQINISRPKNIDEFFTSDSYYIRLQLKGEGKSSGWSDSVLYQATTLTNIGVGSINSTEDNILYANENIEFKFWADKSNNILETDYIDYCTCAYQIDGSELSPWSNRIYSDINGIFSIVYAYELAELYDVSFSLYVNYVTHKGYIGSEIVHYSMAPQDFEIIQEHNVKFSADTSMEKGCNIINADFSDLLTSYMVTDATIKRKSNSSVYWEIIANLDSNPLGTVVFIDNLIEFGEKYEYKLIINCLDKEAFNKARVEMIIDSPINYFEDIFLITKNAAVKIKYNPEITNISYNISESVTPTLGGKYPFIRRVSQQKYQTFTISGLISYHMDEYEDEDTMGYLNNEFIADVSHITDTNIRERMLERNYRAKILEFLHADDVKLFKSETEGNILIRLSNISLTPNPTLGRMIYSFSATATEIAEMSIANCEKYSITNVNQLITDSFVYNDYILYIDEDAIITDEEDNIVLEQVSHII